MTRAGVFIAAAALVGCSLAPGAAPAGADAPSPPQHAMRAVLRARPSSFHFHLGRPAPAARPRCTVGPVPSTSLAQHVRARRCHGEGRRVRGHARHHGAGRARRAARHVFSLPSTAGLAEAEIARVLATPCQNAQLMPEADNLPLVRAAVLCLINRERAQNGEPPLKSNPALEGAAEAHTQDMLAENYFEHVSPSGSTPVDRVRAAGYIPDPGAGYVIGENLAWGTLSLGTPQAIVAAWIASPGHLANILESQYRDTGIAILPQVPAVAATGTAGATYAQEFGDITH